MDGYLQRLQAAITSATRGLSAEELTWHPEGKWSAAEVLEHLYRSYTGTVKGFQRCLESGRPLGSAPTFKQRVVRSVVVGAGYMPGGRQAPDNTRPRGMPAEQVVAEIGPQIAAMEAVIAECEARYGSHAHVLDHPILGPLTARQWRKFHWVHGNHHVKQIRRLRRT
jgi:hypothetical protein